MYTCHDRHLTYDCVTDWLYYSLSYVLHVIVILEMCWWIVHCIILSPYYSFIHIISYPVFSYSGIMVCSYVICMCTFSHFTHSLRVFWLPWICTFRSIVVTFCWSGIWRGSHVLRRAPEFSCSIVQSWYFFSLFLLIHWFSIAWTPYYFIWFIHKITLSWVETYTYYCSDFIAFIDDLCSLLRLF